MGLSNWYEIDEVDTLVTPALVVYPNRIESNIKSMISIAKDVTVLRPHIKTHKIAEIIAMQLHYGIRKFKCATIAEAELLALSGAQDILLAHQPVGVNIDRFINLQLKYRDIDFSTIVDNHKVLEKIGAAAKKNKVTISIWLDVNNGMNRTGAIPNRETAKLFYEIDKHPNLNARGIHVYDGHIHDSDYNIRKEKCDQAFQLVLELKTYIEDLGLTVKTIVAGGTPTFAIHAQRKDIEVCPGTSLLWDYGYNKKYKELEFEYAALVIGRIVSKPKDNLICLNLGHKAIAAEMPFPRMQFLNFNMNQEIMHSEEHLLIASKNPDAIEVGDICYVVPTHICPTVAKYSHAVTVIDNKVTGSWEVAARDYTLNI